jgi:methylenetetrahydrofolate dehydrogenase (NADP+) / methenyltetrahydrofolate cyclohydrolase
VTARRLDGKELAVSLRAQAADAVAAAAAAGTTVRLAIVIATHDESAAWYVRSISRAAARAGIECEIADLCAGAAPDRIAAELARLSAEAAVHGIILQTPVPAGATAAKLAESIDPAKDVDGANPVSLGRLIVGLPAFAPATARAVVRLLDFYGVELSGRRVVVVGRSPVVGKPLAQLLLARDATVTIAHSRTPDLADVTSEAEVLVVAAGRPGLITAAHVRPGATVVDVGTNASNGGLVGDVDAEVAGSAGALSPVPGGVGPVTTAELLLATTVAAGRRGSDKHR